MPDCQTDGGVSNRVTPETEYRRVSEGRSILSRTSAMPPRLSFGKAKKTLADLQRIAYAMGAMRNTHTGHGDETMKTMKTMTKQQMDLEQDQFTWWPPSFAEMQKAEGLGRDVPERFVNNRTQEVVFIVEAMA